MRRIRFRARKRVGVLPILRANVDLKKLRITSWTWHFWRWSWNTSTRSHTLDTPGPGSLQISGDEPRRGRRTR